MKQIVILATGERLLVDDAHGGGALIRIDNHREAVSGETIADCLDAFATQFTTLAQQLALVARAHRKVKKATAT